MSDPSRGSPPEATTMIGRRLGEYVIVATLGEGGMGRVYRARDPRLDRNVAIKISKEQFSDRFAREARLVASLNHPNICTLHDVGPNYLVMELIEGESPHGPLPLATVVAYARQIAAALDAAHERGIVHRDLKPANIKVTPQGLVKVLDFGVAKVVDTPGGGGTDGTTHTADSGIGSIIGTPAYMSPEQAAGRPVDKRTDIWAFGAILYELLTGARPFQGATATETIAAILQSTPDLSRVPWQARALVTRCLEKDPARRLRDIGDAMTLVDDTPRIEPAKPMRSRWLWPALASLFAALAVVMWWAPWRHPVAPMTATFQIAPPAGNTLVVYVVLSPDGRRLVFTAQGPDGRMRLWLRDLDSLKTRPLEHAEITTSSTFGSPFWSPDSRYIAFADGDTLKRVDAAGAEPSVVITKKPGVRVGPGTWSRSGTILFMDRNAFSSGSQPDVAIWRVPASGGEATPIVAVKGHIFGLPWFLPDDRHFLFVETGTSALDVFVGSLDTAPDRQQTARLLQSQSQPIYVPSATSTRGWLAFMQQDTLVAQAFDPDRMQLSGDPIPIAERVAILPTPGYGSFSISSTGELAYRQSGGVQLTWLDRQGRTLDRVADLDFAGALRISPDGRRGAIDYQKQIWLIDFERGTQTRFTLGSDRSELPFWSPDGTQIVFRSLRAKKWGFYVRASDGSGTERLIFESDKERWIDDWSPDGQFILFNEYSPNSDVDLGMIPVTGGAPIPLLQTPFDEGYAQLSHNGHLLAYESSQTGHPEVYVRTFRATGGRPELGPDHLVSTNGGRRPLWRGDQLLFLSAGGALMSAEIQETPLRTSAPRLLSQLPSLPNLRFFDVDPTGQRLLLPAPAENPNAITIVTKWLK
jgi:Tol biopolymer transport system component/tRNA A-37 threonylcarbamoyl transferase component Bud32